MKTIKVLMLAIGFIGAASAQQWYAGAIGGFGFTPAVTATNSSGTAQAGFQGGAVAGAFLGNDAHTHWGGEFRYVYQESNIKLSSGGTSAEFDARTNIFHYDVLVYPAAHEARVRPYAAVGGGMKMLQGTGTESANQPLGNFAALTATKETTWVVDGGAGVRASFGKSWQIRFEARDYVSPSPSKVITAAPGTTLSGWMNNVVGMVEIAYTWH